MSVQGDDEDDGDALGVLRYVSNEGDVAVVDRVCGTSQ
jgi:hypothetical protein